MLRRGKLEVPDLKSLKGDRGLEEIMIHYRWYRRIRENRARET